MQTTTETIRFKSEGINCAGTIYKPEGHGPFPAVLMSHGFGAVRAMRNIPEVGQLLAEAGILALAIDFRFLGDSEGFPRQQVLPNAQRQDLRNAISYLETRSDVNKDKIGLWGTSFSGGQSIRVAAFDRRIKALVAQVPATDLFRQIRYEAPEAQQKILQDAIDKERARHFAGEEPHTMKLADQEGSPSVFGVESLDWATRNEAEHASFYNAVTITSLEEAIQTAPGDYIAAVSPTPFLVIMAEPDKTVVITLTEKAFKQAQQPKKLIRYQGLHYDVYDRPEILKMASEAARDWFVEHLSV
ncbi:alpha/beta hydrolase [Mucilaginibacter terrae]|uniref:Dienelactone hydrolase n=1 Tax=Mucilaginibacter terrae TaxID=1955052 RepID=A0ABU3H088_9SPHI|nr:CocE/NonD family hydrolase [Mucilaginibacter terrae]MDT3405438.1 dienelactone hydrolase [Mucilaginibacter terrae]